MTFRFRPWQDKDAAAALAAELARQDDELRDWWWAQAPAEGTPVPA